MKIYTVIVHRNMVGGCICPECKSENTQRITESIITWFENGGAYISHDLECSKCGYVDAIGFEVEEDKQNV